MSKDVVFLGAKMIGYLCFKSLLKKQKEGKCKIVGVLTRDTNLDNGENIRDLCKRFNIKCLNSLNEFLIIPNVDIVISVQHDEILKLKHINKANQIAVNLHLAPLPEYRGCNQFSFAILDEADWFGATIHEINEDVDSGDVIFEKRFRISNDNLWVSELYEKTMKSGVELFQDNLENLLNENYSKTPQDSLVHERGTSIHYRNEIQGIKKIDLNWPTDKILRHVRATSMPGFEPPYAEENGTRFYIIPEKFYKK